MTKTNLAVLKLMNVLFWIAFIGLCIKTGSLLISFIVSLVVSPAGAANLYLGLNLENLYSYSRIYYVSTVLMLIVLTGLKAHIAYLIIKCFMKFDLQKPFNEALTKFFLRISYVSLFTGLIAILAEGFGKLLSKKGMSIPIDWGGNEILFFAGVIYLLALVFKKGTDLQTESDLTV